MFELVEVERQRRGWDPQPFADLSRRKPLGSDLHQQPDNIETRLITERDKRGYGFLLFHISIMMKLWGASSHMLTIDKLFYLYALEQHWAERRCSFAS